MSPVDCWASFPALLRRVTLLVDGAAGLGELLEGDGAEGLLVLGEIVAEHVPESLSLLRAEVDALEVFDGEFVGALLAHGPEDEEEVPDAHADLDAVGVAVAVVFGGCELKRGLILSLLGRVRVLRAHRISFRLGYAANLEESGAGEGTRTPTDFSAWT